MAYPLGNVGLQLSWESAALAQRRSGSPYPLASTTASQTSISFLRGCQILVNNRSICRRHRRTLERMRTRPTSADIRWAEIESLLNAMGVDLFERAGSRVQLVKGSDSVVVHRPHPRPEVSRDTVRDIARFIERIGEG